MRYTLRQLEVFLACAEYQNITRAADSLAMSQSAASGALRDLERQFDVLLFDRIGKRLQINELGLALRPQAEALMEQARALQSSLTLHNQVCNLKLGATLSIGNYLATDLITRFLDRQPEAKISLEVANTAEITHKVVNFELDLGLIEGEVYHPELEVLDWREDELVVFSAPSHPLAAQQRLEDRNLLEATWILRESGSGTRQSFDRAMHGLLPKINILLELQHTEAIKRAVESGLGISCLSRITLQDAFRRGNLVPLAVPQRDLRRRLYIILHRKKYRSAAINLWLDLCLGEQQRGL